MLPIAYDTVRIFDADSIENSHHPQRSHTNDRNTSMSRLGKALRCAPQSRSSELRSRWLLMRTATGSGMRTTEEMPRQRL